MKFSKKITHWYSVNKRDLPWRKTNNPYKIWVSEIILQQTRISQGLEYYNRFIDRFPNIHSLANAQEKDVLNQWQGLGYYTRARNLHKTAKYVESELNSIFPSTYLSILKLSGIGEYTAAAIASISFNLPYPVVDGNVMRLFSRIFGIIVPVNSSSSKKLIYNIANMLMDQKVPGLFNQAIMEFGALKCKPQNPDCNHCIFRNNCYAHQNKCVHQLPVSRVAITQRKRYFNYLVIRSLINNRLHIYLNKRVKNDIWKNLFDFPMIETSKKIKQSLLKERIKEFLNIKTGINIQNISREYKHILSHQIIYARFTIVEVSDSNVLKNLQISSELKLHKTTENSLSGYPVPKLIDTYIKENDIFRN